LETIFQQLDRCCRPTGGWTKSYDGTHLLRTSECFVNGAMRPVVPTIVYSHWIKHLRDLGLLSNKEICDGEDYARTRPEKLVEMMNMVFNERAKTVSRIKRDKLLNMITDISRYTSLGNPRNLPSNYFVNIPMKITTWRQKIEEMSRIESVQKSLLRNLEVIMNSAKTASDSYTMIREMRALLPQLTQEAKDYMGRLLIDVKRSVLRQKLAQLLTNYDSDIDIKTKQKLANMIIVEETFDNQQVMMTQMQQMTTVVQKLMAEEVLPKQLISELHLTLSRLGIELDERARLSTAGFYGGIQKYISINELLSMLSLQSSATFPVPNKAACNIDKFCQRRVLETVCTYGYIGCQATIMSVNGKTTCELSINGCQKTTNIPQLTEEQIVKMLRTQQYAETVAFSQEACSAVGMQFMNQFSFGGTSIKVQYNGLSKKCSLRITGAAGTRNWLNQECGPGCDFSKLKYLDLAEVGEAAKISGARGVRFLTRDEATCKQYCSNDIDIPSHCMMGFQCKIEIKCWTGTCICTVSHICRGTSGYGNRMIGKEKTHTPGNSTSSEIIEQPRIMPLVRKTSVIVERKKEEKKPGKKTKDQKEEKDEGEMEEKKTKENERKETKEKKEEKSDNQNQ